MVLEPNITTVQYALGITEAAGRLPNIIKNWELLDSDLRIEYIEQIEWLLETADLVAARNDAEQYKEDILAAKNILLDLYHLIP